MIRTLSLLVGATAIATLAACSCPREGGCCGGKPGCKGAACAGEKPAACCAKPDAGTAAPAPAPTPAPAK